MIENLLNAPFSFEDERPNKQKKFIDYFDFKRIIGSGAFSQVISAIDKKDGTNCAIKVYFNFMQKKKKNFFFFYKQKKLTQFML